MTSERKHTILEVSDLSIGYGRKKTVEVIAKDINFALSEGELVGLVGANGVGKSTLLRTLAKMQSPLNGQISLANKLLGDYTSLGLANQLSVVLTEAPASKNLTVYELVALGRQPHTNWMGRLSEIDETAIQLALEHTESFHLSEKKCYELSDGQLQRVYIARALAQDTPCIVLDEPTTHLDIYHRAYILQLLKKLTRENNKAIFFSTHEVDIAIQLSDKLVIMTDTDVYFDTPKNLIEHGSFDLLFPKKIISFDQQTGRFTINN